MATDNKAPNIQGAPVAYIQAHVGIMINHQSVTGIHHEKHGAQMHLTPVGVHVRFARDGKSYLVPYANIESVELLP